MVFYNCEKCGKEFNRKSNYLYHIENVSNCDKIKKKKIHKCNYCDKLFTLKNNLIRHNKICKKKYKNMDMNTIMDIDKNKNNNDETISDKKDENNKKSNNEINGNINISNIQKQTINNNQTINNTQNIQILVNPFGKEEIILLPDDLCFDAIKNLIKGIPLLIKYVHYNVKFPQNKNIKGKGLCSKYIEIHDGEDWIIDTKKNIIHKLIIDNKDKLDDFFDEQIEKNKISKNLANRYEKQTEKLDEVLNEEFRGEKPLKESINFFKELEEEVNITIENETNKEKKRKKKVLD
jgi:hypothetical protein